MEKVNLIIQIGIDSKSCFCDGCFAFQDPLACPFIWDTNVEDENYIPFRLDGQRLPACLKAEQKFNLLKQLSIAWKKLSKIFKSRAEHNANVVAENSPYNGKLRIFHRRLQSQNKKLKKDLEECKAKLEKLKGVNK